ncbi:unnamed protein product [Symbiodinium sp. CCMP2592]|nr:unnamed protein product [Symbiodinium sp. CCMP2592]
MNDGADTATEAEGEQHATCTGETGGKLSKRPTKTKPSKKNMARHFSPWPCPGGSGASKSALSLISQMTAGTVGPVLSLRTSLAGCRGADLHAVLRALENNQDIHFLSIGCNGALATSTSLASLLAQVLRPAAKVCQSAITYDEVVDFLTCTKLPKTAVHYMRVSHTVRKEAELYLPKFATKTADGKKLTPKFCIDDGRLHFAIVSGFVFNSFELPPELSVVGRACEAGSIAAARVTRSVLKGMRAHGHEMTDLDDLETVVDKLDDDKLRQEVADMSRPYLALTHLLNLLDAQRISASRDRSLPKWASMLQKWRYATFCEDSGSLQGDACEWFAHFVPLSNFVLWMLPHLKGTMFKTDAHDMSGSWVIWSRDMLLSARDSVRFQYKVMATSRLLEAVGTVEFPPYEPLLALVHFCRALGRRHGRAAFVVFGEIETLTFGIGLAQLSRLDTRCDLLVNAIRKVSLSLATEMGVRANVNTTGNPVVLRYERVEPNEPEIEANFAYAVTVTQAFVAMIRAAAPTEHQLPEVFGLLRWMGYDMCCVRDSFSKSQKVMTEPKVATSETVEAAKSAAGSVAKQVSECHLIKHHRLPTIIGRCDTASELLNSWFNERAATVDAMLKHAPPNRAWFDVPFARLIRFDPIPDPAKNTPPKAVMLPTGNVTAMYNDSVLGAHVEQQESRKLTQSTWESLDEAFVYLLWFFCVLPVHVAYAIYGSSPKEKRLDWMSRCYTFTVRATRRFFSVGENNLSQEGGMMNYIEAQTVTASEKEVTKRLMGAPRQHHASVTATDEAVSAVKTAAINRGSAKGRVWTWRLQADFKRWCQQWFEGCMRPHSILMDRLHGFKESANLWVKAAADPRSPLPPEDRLVWLSYAKRDREARFLLKELHNTTPERVRESRPDLPPEGQAPIDPVYTGAEWKGANPYNFEYFTRQQLIFAECIQVRAHRYHPPAACVLSAIEFHGCSEAERQILAHYRLMRIVVRTRAQLQAEPVGDTMSVAPMTVDFEREAYDIMRIVMAEINDLFAEMRSLTQSARNRKPHRDRPVVRRPCRFFTTAFFQRHIAVPHYTTAHHPFPDARHTESNISYLLGQELANDGLITPVESDLRIVRKPGHHFGPPLWLTSLAGGRTIDQCLEEARGYRAASASAARAMTAMKFSGEYNEPLGMADSFNEEDKAILLDWRHNYHGQEGVYRTDARWGDGIQQKKGTITTCGVVADAGDRSNTVTWLKGAGDNQNIEGTQPVPDACCIGDEFKPEWVRILSAHVRSFTATLFQVAEANQVPLKWEETVANDSSIEIYGRKWAIEGRVKATMAKKVGRLSEAVNAVVHDVFVVMSSVWASALSATSGCFTFYPVYELAASESFALWVLDHFVPSTLPLEPCAHAKTVSHRMGFFIYMVVSVLTSEFAEHDWEFFLMGMLEVARLKALTRERRLLDKAISSTKVDRTHAAWLDIPRVFGLVMRSKNLTKCFWRPYQEGEFWRRAGFHCSGLRLLPDSAGKRVNPAIQRLTNALHRGNLEPLALQKAFPPGDTGAHRSRELLEAALKRDLPPAPLPRWVLPGFIREPQKRQKEELSQPVLREGLLKRRRLKEEPSRDVELPIQLE